MPPARLMRVQTSTEPLSGTTSPMNWPKHHRAMAKVMSEYVKLGSLCLPLKNTNKPRARLEAERSNEDRP